MSSADLRYPRQTLWADYVRATAGVLLCGVPLLALEVNRWLALILAAGLATLMVLHKVSYLIALGPYHDLLGTLFVMVAWPAITLVFRFCVKHGLWVLLCS